jgi:hypothetical protein
MRASSSSTTPCTSCCISAAAAAVEAGEVGHAAGRAHAAEKAVALHQQRARAVPRGADGRRQAGRARRRPPATSNSPNTGVLARRLGDAWPAPAARSLQLDAAASG